MVTAGSHVNLLITGATGFVGSALVDHLLHTTRCRLVVVSRRPQVAAGLWSTADGRLTVTDYNNLSLAGIDQVIHLAAVAHSTEKVSKTDLRRSNVQLTAELAQRAISAGVKHFIFTSSAYVHGNHGRGEFFSERSPLLPSDGYAESKVLAEEALMRLSESSLMKVTIVRLAPVYGAEAPGNFHRLMEWIAEEKWLPLLGARAQRTLLSRENLVDVLAGFCMDGAWKGLEKENVYLLADRDALSTADVVKVLTEGMGRRNRLFYVPLLLLRLLMAASGKRKQFATLCMPFLVDSTKIRKEIGWYESSTARELLRKSGASFMRSYKGMPDCSRHV